MQLIPRSVATLIEEFGKLPGIGPRSAERLTFFLLRIDPAHSQRLAEAVGGLQEGIQQCQTCFNLAEDTVCAICAHPDRDRSMVAVVEEPLDVVAIEKTGLYKG